MALQPSQLAPVLQTIDSVARFFPRIARPHLVILENRQQYPVRLHGYVQRVGTQVYQQPLNLIISAFTHVQLTQLRHVWLHVRLGKLIDTLAEVLAGLLGKVLMKVTHGNPRIEKLRLEEPHEKRRRLRRRLVGGRPRGPRSVSRRLHCQREGKSQSASVRRPGGHLLVIFQSIYSMYQLQRMQAKKWSCERQEPRNLPRLNPVSASERTQVHRPELPAP